MINYHTVYLIRLLIGLVIIGLFSISTMVLSSEDCSGIGGTGLSTTLGGDGSGIGGTGHSSCKGIGGTGIVGVITGFGSIWVNGVEVHYDTNTPVMYDNTSSEVQRLSIGQIVAVEAKNSDGRMQAVNINVLHIVAGPVHAVNIEKQTIEVLGQTIQMNEYTLIDEQGKSASSKGYPNLGDFILVSGQRRSDGTVLATLIDYVPSRAEVSVLGPVSNSQNGEFMIYGLSITGKATTIGDASQLKMPVLVKGRLSGDRLIAEEMRMSPVAALVNSAETIVIEGYAQQRSDEGITIEGIPIKLKGQPLDGYLRVNAHVQHGGELVVDTVEHLKMDDWHRNASESINVISKRHETEPKKNSELGKSETTTPEEHEVRKSEMEAPETETPEMETPEMETPEMETPEMEAPEMEAPEMEAPEMETPEMEVPEMEVPEMEVPEMEVPEMEVPEVEVPEVEMPEMGMSG